MVGIDRICLIYVFLQCHPGLGRGERKNGLLTYFDMYFVLKEEALLPFLQASHQLRC